MGHHSESCALSNLGIYMDNPAISIAAVGKHDVYDYQGLTYSMLETVKQLRRNRRDAEEFAKLLADLDPKTRKPFETLRETKCPFKVIKGKYSGYGDIQGIELPEKVQIMFFHPEVWEFCQGLWPELKKPEHQTEEEFEIENVLSAAMWLRVQLHWSEGHLGCQDPEEDEFVKRENFLSLLQKINNKQKIYYSLEAEIDRERNT